MFASRILAALRATLTGLSAAVPVVLGPVTQGPGALGLVALSLVASGAIAPAAMAQPANNALVPGIVPYAPKAAPGASAPNASTAKSDKPTVAPTPLNQAAGADSKSTISALVPAKDAKGYDYILGAGDKLRITVFGEDNLSSEFYVAGNGDISFPLIGEVPASGKTVGAVVQEIQTELKAGYIKDPRVSAEVLTFRPFYIYGEVTKPGEYPYSDGITVLNAVATAGGFTYRANQKYVFIKTANEAVEHKVKLTDGLTIAPGDTIRIAERYF